MTTKRVRLCAWCKEPVQRKSLNGPVPTYCRRSCRQRAYEKRRTDELLEQEKAKWLTAASGALATEKPSRDESGSAPDLSRDESPECAPSPAAPPRPPSRRAAVAEAVPLFPVDEGDG